MKSCLTVCLIILLIFVLLIGGLVFALRPPFRVQAPLFSETSDTEIQAAFRGYIMERLESAMDDYPGEGDLHVTLDQVGLTQVLSDALGSQIEGLPAGLKFTGMFSKFRQDYIQIGAGFKFLFIHAGLSARIQIQVQDGNMELKLLSTHLGRIPLPIDFVLNTAGRFDELPGEISSLSVTAPLNFEDENLGITLSQLEMKPEQLVISLQLEEGLIPEIPDSVVDSFEESIPEINDILADNPVASEALSEIQVLLEQAEAEGKQVNPLRLMTLGEQLHSALNEDELNQLNEVLDDDIKELLDQFQGTN